RAGAASVTVSATSAGPRMCRKCISISFETAPVPAEGRAYIAATWATMRPGSRAFCSSRACFTVSGIREDDMAANGSFYRNELMTRDAEAAKKFYGATLGWTFEPMGQGEGATYWVAKVGEESVAGIYTIEPNDQDTGEGWFCYVAVDDLSG